MTFSDDGVRHVVVVVWVVARRQRVRGGRRGVPAVRADDDDADDVRRAHPARRLHPADDRADARRRARPGATRAAARAAEDHLRRTPATGRPHLQHVRYTRTPSVRFVVARACCATQPQLIESNDC